MHANGNDVTYFDSFGAEHIPKEIKKFIDNKNTTTNILRIQTYDLLCVHTFTWDLLILCSKAKVSWILQNYLKKNDKVILNYFLK